VDAASSLSSLDWPRDAKENARRSIDIVRRLQFVTNPIHRFEESIGGRPYLIEVALVSQDRWRAYIVRIPGVPTALMPFYGSTPAAAASLLTEWLSRAHRCAAAGSTG
jgi:hypothetical protein